MSKVQFLGKQKPDAVTVQRTQIKTCHYRLHVEIRYSQGRCTQGFTLPWIYLETGWCVSTPLCAGPYRGDGRRKVKPRRTCMHLVEHIHTLTHKKLFTDLGSISEPEHHTLVWVQCLTQWLLPLGCKAHTTFTYTCTLCTHTRTAK